MTEQSGHKDNRVIPWIAILLSVIAIAMSATAMFRPVPEPALTKSEYDQIVNEVWGLVEAISDDFDLAKPKQQPESLAEALRPLFGLVRPIQQNADDP